jgi:hypothetical protein
MSPLFASPSIGFWRIFTTSVFSEKRFSTHSIDSFRLPGLTWTVTFMLLLCPFYTCIHKWCCKDTHTASEDPIREDNTPHKGMIACPKRDIARDVHSQIHKEGAIDTLWDKIGEIGWEPEWFSFKFITKMTEDDDIEYIWYCKGGDTCKRKTNCLTKNRIKRW